MRREWIEHPTPCSSDTCSTNWATTAFLFRENDGGRTHDQRSHNPLLYQLSYNLHSCGRSGIRTHCVSYVLGLQPSAQPPSEQPSHYFVWMTRLERALAITACSGSQNRRGLPTPPHPDYMFSKLINELKNKKSFVITEEALYKLYCIVTLITFLKIYFITIPISKRHAMKWTSIKGWTNNRTNMWINLIHVFYDIFKFINNNKYFFLKK